MLKESINVRTVHGLCLVAWLLLGPVCHAQEKAPAPSPSPTPRANEDQESVKVFTEEVLIPVVAYDKYGRFDPTLE